MTREELKLNNFESFDQYLFGDFRPDWSKFYDKETNIFTPPILKPETLPEYQLDHYALWMVVFVYALKEKPKFSSKAYYPTSRCYACDYKVAVRKLYTNCRDYCPLVLDDYHGCGYAYSCWDDNCNRQKNAYTVAHLKWIET